MNRVFGRVVFYTPSDLSSGGHLQDAEPILRGFDPDHPIQDVNDVLELYNIQLYIDAGCRLRSWTEDDLKSFKETVSGFKPFVVGYMSKINEHSFAVEYHQVEDTLKPSFWSVFSMYKVYERVPAMLIKDELAKDENLIEILLENQALVKAYDGVIGDYMRGNKDCIDLLLSAYLLELDFPERKPNIPASLTLEDRDQLIGAFIDSATPNISLLRIIEQAKNTNELRITAENRLKAKRKRESLYEGMMQTSSAMSYSITVELLDSEEDWGVRLLTNATNDYKLQYNERLLSSYDNERLVNMYADHYEYLNMKLLMTLPFNYITDMILLEYLSGYRGKRDYHITSAFIFKQQVAIAQMAFHRQYLKGRGKRLEELLGWYYETNFRSKYGYNSGKMKLASEETDNVNKIRSIIPEIESVLKRYDIFAINGIIDEELLPYYQGVHITETRSILPKKYVYGVEGCRDVFLPIRYLFQPGSLMDKVPSDFKGEHNLFNTIRFYSVTYNDYNEWQKENIDYLIEQGLIIKDDNGVLSLGNEGRIAALYDIHHDGVISYWNHPQIVKEEVDVMLTNGMLYDEATLFSKPEKAYLNYLLNDKQFTNGPALRNEYAHGDQPLVGERAHETAYNYLLIVLVCVLLKMQSEFMMRNQIS